VRLARAADPERLLAFWFEEAGPAKWFSGGTAFDSRVRRLYGPLVHALDAELALSRTVLAHPWIVNAATTLALILALDQFPRHVFRGSNRAFALDRYAVEAAHLAVEFDYDLVLPPAQRAFIYLPFSHSETLADQAFGVSLCETRLDDDEAGRSNVRHARAHRDVIARFGRFPHRNAALGRPATPEETAFLDAGGYAPGAGRRAK